MAKISLIVAVSNNGVIGKDNKLPWYIPEDLSWFKINTLGKPIIMGRKTHEAIGKKLPGRLNIVISSNKNYKPLSPQVKVFASLKEVINAYFNLEELIIIGGEKIYKEALPFITKIYRTKIMSEFVGDAFFPEINEKEWKIIENRMSGNQKILYEFQILEKIIIQNI